MKHVTEHENFWTKEFGDLYVIRKNSAEILLKKIILVYK